MRRRHPNQTRSDDKGPLGRNEISAPRNENRNKKGATGLGVAVRQEKLTKLATERKRYGAEEEGNLTEKKKPT